MPWVLYSAGILFCAAGIYLFLKNVLEEDRSLKWPLLITIMGVILISLATAKRLHLIY